MSHIEKLNGEFRNLLAGVERARGLAAAADSRAQEVGRRASVPASPPAAGTARVRDAIRELQNGLAVFADSITAATMATTATAPHAATPEEAVAVLEAVLSAVDRARDAAVEAIARIARAQQVVAVILHGGQPGPLLDALESIKRVLLPVAQRTNTARQSVETAIVEVRQFGVAGKLMEVGAPTPTSPVPAATDDPPSTAATGGTAASAGHGPTPPWTRQPTGVVGGSPTGPRTRIPPQGG
ncbi:DUF6244 family protein [Micromonospora sp. NPDC047465]|uniref:DUF6244 family protein n=1 Tax=Micromonospora sp. NPDC047465 TaxID=3154813 RepID=UPI0033D505B8